MVHQEKIVFVKATPTEVFEFIDEHSHLSSHMGKSSWMMSGGKMETSIDSGHFKKIGSHLKMEGKVFGILLFLDEVVTHYDPPNRKEWKTVDEPRLIVIGGYKMGIEINKVNNGSKVKLFIDYQLPKSFFIRPISYLLGPLYANWCLQQMLNSIMNHFKT